MARTGSYEEASGPHKTRCRGVSRGFAYQVSCPAETKGMMGTPPGSLRATFFSFFRAGGKDQANSDAEAELQIRVHHSDAHLLQANRRGLGPNQTGNIRCVRGMQGTDLESPIRSRALDALVPRVQRAPEYLSA